MPRLCSVLLLWLLIAGSASGVTMDWTSIGNPGNACDVRYPGGSECYGTVPYEYQIAKFEVTNAQYTDFLNAVGADDPNRLYNTDMARHDGLYTGGITRIGSAGNYHYQAIEGREEMPVVLVSFWDSLRFVNWIANGQPTGAQGLGTTETGSYTITTAGLVNNTITRNPGATIVLASEEEWYKAAYYDPGSSSYHNFAFADGFDGVSCVAPASATTSHSANCNYAIGTRFEGELAPVGSYPGSPGSYGTLDQTGNVTEWTEARGFTSGTAASHRVIRGGSFASDTTTFGTLSLSSTYRFTTRPQDEMIDVGFRLAMIPEPSTGLLVIAGLIGFAIHQRGRA